MKNQKTFCVALLSGEDWDEPNIVFVEAEDEDQAWDMGLEKFGYSEEEFEEARENYHVTILVKEVVVS